jgi:hypothetical protein
MRRGRRRRSGRRYGRRRRRRPRGVKAEVGLQLQWLRRIALDANLSCWSIQSSRPSDLL